MSSSGTPVLRKFFPCARDVKESNLQIFGNAFTVSKKCSIFKTVSLLTSTMKYMIGMLVSRTCNCTVISTIIVIHTLNRIQCFDGYISGPVKLELF